MLTLHRLAADRLRIVQTPARIVALALIMNITWTSLARAQEALHTPAATHPSTDTWTLRQQLNFAIYGRRPRHPSDRTRVVESTTTVTYGLRHDIALSLAVPLKAEQSSHAGGRHRVRHAGLADLELAAKVRVYQHDFGPVDTFRVSLFGGAEMPSGDGPVSSSSVDPFAGAVGTLIAGRHGFSQSLAFKLNTGGDVHKNLGGDGPDDALRADSAYLFRLFPANWADGDNAALYAVAELNVLYETGGDLELVLSPGLLYEATQWAAELGLRIPIARELQDRPELDWGLTAGLRFRF